MSTDIIQEKVDQIWENIEDLHKIRDKNTEPPGMLSIINGILIELAKIQIDVESIKKNRK